MKKLIYALIGLLIVFCIVLCEYLSKYTIKNDKNQIEANIVNFINRPTVVANNIDIVQDLNLDNKKYILFKINDILGEAELTKGLNKKYKIENVGYGSACFKYEIFKTNKGKYLILKGKNFNNKIAYIKVQLDGKEYKIIIPKQEYFIAYCAVPDDTQRIYPESDKIKSYNVNDVDITNEMFKKLF